MVVAFTPNIGLAKPPKTELALEWARNTKLLEDNNLIVIDKMDFPPITYTPALIGSTTNPSVGAGTNVAEYYEFQGYIFGNWEATFVNPGIVVGTGTGAYGISLPFPADGAFHTVGTSLNDTNGALTCIGEGHIMDNLVANGGSVGIDVVTIGGVGYMRMMTETYPAKATTFVTPGAPVAVDNNDKWSANFVYKRA